VNKREASARRPVDRVTSLSDRWFRLRNRVLSDPRFQRWAARSLFVRFMARRRAAALFDLCAGFVYSQVLQAAVRLRLFEALTSGPQTLADLAPRLGLSSDAARRLLDAATSLRLVERRGGDRYGLGVHGAAFIGNPAVAAMVEHHALVYRDLADPVALLRGEQRETELSRFWSYADHGSEAGEKDVAAYSRLMAASLSLIAQDILEAYPHGRHRSLLDVGGGEGAFLEAAAAETPHLSLSLFDLPPVARRAEERFERAGLSARVKVVGGDVLRDPLPEGADLVSLVRVVHDHDDPQALHILRSVRRILRPGGVLLVAEPMAGTRGAEPVGDAYFGFYLLAMGQGRARTEERLRALLLEAGFDRVRAKRTRRPMLSRLLVAEVR
jgi:demethylspheroidene O-methyltransferase